MAKNTSSFKHESLQDKASVLAYLNLISQGIEKGQIHLANEEDDVTLNTKGLSRLKIKAKQAKSHQELRITLAWSGDPESKNDAKPTQEVTSQSAKSNKKAKKVKIPKKSNTDKKAKVKSKAKPDKVSKKAK